MLELIRSIITSALIILGVQSMCDPAMGWALGKVSGILLILFILIITYYVLQRESLFNWKYSDIKLYKKLKKYFYWGLIGAIFSVAIRNLDVIIISNT